MFSDDPVHEPIHSGDEFGASESDFLRVEPCKPREVVGPVELAKEIVAFFDESTKFIRFGI